MSVMLNSRLDSLVEAGISASSLYHVDPENSSG